MTTTPRLAATALAAHLAISCSPPPRDAASPPPATPSAVQPSPVTDATPAPAVSPSDSVPVATPDSPSPASAPAPAKGHHHAHAAPHGGTLVELGEEFAHLELMLDSATGGLTAYALDGEAERPARLTQPAMALTITIPEVLAPISIDLQPVENPLTGEKAGDTSQFQAVVPELKGRRLFRGTVAVVTVRGQTFERVPFNVPARVAK